MQKTKNSTQNEKVVRRPPIVVVLGHVDHGKSTLLDYIRKSNVVEGEKGGITQHMYSYEIIHKDESGKNRKITFLDTPGHAAFSLMRERGANIADMAILVVAADEGVKPQTLEALSVIKGGALPYVVALNKIDKPEANTEKTKQGLAEHEVFLEGYGGDIPAVLVSAKTGDGVKELLDMVLLMAEIGELTGNFDKNAEGIVAESHHDPKKGVSATLIIKDGTLREKMYVATSSALSPVRFIENSLGEKIPLATFSSPVRIVGFNALPHAGDAFSSFKTKREAEEYMLTPKHLATAAEAPRRTDSAKEQEGEVKILTIPLIIKADTAGTVEAVESEIKKIQVENVIVRVLDRGVGAISETDVKRASGSSDSLIVGFNVVAPPRVARLAEQYGILIQTFDIIYKLTEWLAEEIEKRRPRIRTEEIIGKAKIIRIFSKDKDKQVIGGKVNEGKLRAGAIVKILRRDFEIGRGKILELQQQKVKTSEVAEGFEFGAMVESKHEIATGDAIEAVEIVEK